jgi:hypothetical protein
MSDAALVLGWTTTVLILLGYFASGWKRRPELFDWTNVMLCVPAAWANVVVGAAWASALSLAFGVVGWVSIDRRRGRL